MEGPHERYASRSNRFGKVSAYAPRAAFPNLHLGGASPDSLGREGSEGMASRAEARRQSSLGVNGQDLPAPQLARKESRASINHFEVADLAHAQQLVASVEVHIPWYIIDPQGVNIKKQRRREAAERHVDAISKRQDFNDQFRAVRASTAQASAEHHKEEQHQPKTSCFADWTLFPSWDGITGLALLFTVTVTPFEVGFLDPPTRPDALWIVNRVVDVVFVFDVIFQFFIMVPRRSEGSSAWGSGDDGVTRWETDLKVIGCRYAKGWFTIDVASIAPFIFDILPLLNPEGGSTRGAKALRTIRALRLIKLLRLMRASRIFGRLKERISWSTASVTLITLTFQVIVLTHALACSVAIIATFYPSKLDTWFGTFGYCELAGYDEDGDKIESCVNPAELYRASLTWGLGLLVDFQGEPDSGPMDAFYADPDRPVKFTVPEEIIVLTAKLVCLFAWTLIFGKLLAVLTHQDPDTMAYQVDLDSMNRAWLRLDPSTSGLRRLAFAALLPVPLAKSTDRIFASAGFCGVNRLNTELTLDVRRYFFKTLAVRHSDSRTTALSKLSPALQEKIVWHINAVWLADLPMFEMLKRKLRESQKKSFLCQLVLRMKAELFAAKEIPPPKRLYFITSGTVLNRPTGGAQVTLGPGATWGAADVLSRRPGLISAVAVGYVQVQYIARDELFELKAEHPRPFMIMYYWTMLREMGKYLTRELKKLPPAIQKKSHIGKKLKLMGGFQVDRARAVLEIDGIDCGSVRFPGDVDVDDLPSEGIIMEVQQKVGGTVKVKLDNGAVSELPNPRTLPYNIDEQEDRVDLQKQMRKLNRMSSATSAFGMLARPKGVAWTPEDVDKTSLENLSKLKKAVDAAVEMKQAQETKFLQDELRMAKASLAKQQVNLFPPAADLAA